MSNNQLKIRDNLIFLFEKYPDLKNKNYNYLFIKYVLEFHFRELFILFTKKLDTLPAYFEKLPSCDNIGRQKRKLAEINPRFRPDNYKVIAHRKNKTKEILESVRNND